jgi:uncharacterized Tic20 family protein
MSDTPAGTNDKEQRNWAMLAHLSALLAFATVIGGIVAPLIIWLIRKDDMSFAAAQAKEALNFQITVYLIALGLWLTFVTVILIPVAVLALAVLAVADIVLIIVAAIKVNEGIPYRYPFNLRLIP